MNKFRTENSQDSGTFAVWLLGFVAGKRHRRTLVLLGLGLPFPEPCRCTGARGTGTGSPERALLAVSEHKKCMNLWTNTRTCSWTHLGSTVQIIIIRVPYGDVRNSEAARVPRTSGPPYTAESNMSNSETGLRLWD